MEKDPVSSTTSTGGAGIFYEQHVNAYWLALLLTKGIPPILIDCTVNKVCMQTEHRDWKTDDFLICCENGAGENRKIAGQVKLSFTVSSKNVDCKKTIQDFWKDFSSKSEFRSDSALFAIVTQRGYQDLAKRLFRTLGLRP